jgi:hypothetical protein
MSGKPELAIPLAVVGVSLAIAVPRLLKAAPTTTDHVVAAIGIVVAISVVVMVVRAWVKG